MEAFLTFCLVVFILAMFGCAIVAAWLHSLFAMLIALFVLFVLGVALLVAFGTNW